MGAFERFAPFIQDYIYAHEWEGLRGIQVAAAEAIFDTDDNVLLTASTASGKTEAAFFPILTEFYEDPPASVGALYIAPLKSLINDQFLRLGELIEQAETPVWRWHGDVSASQKARLVKKPSGILQITPESLESLLMRKHAALPHLFGDLRYIVIDEVHSLLRADRGGQTLCLIERLSRASGSNARRIGLSATIGDPEAVGRVLAAGTGRKTVIPRFSEPEKVWRISMEHFYVSGPQAPEREAQDTASRRDEVITVEPVEPLALPAAGGSDHRSLAEGHAARFHARAGAHAMDAPSDTAPDNADPGYGYVFEHTRGKKCLVFSNSREEAEAITTTLRAYCEARREPDRFLIHHGNLSSAYRETAEDLMRDEELDLTTVTTATLELGIDIGRLERAFQVNAPFTVSAFLQRMGRTGRRGEPQEMWFVMREDEPEPRAQMPECIPWELLQGIALVQCYREERWVEPPRLERLPYSLLYHQTMAILAASGELSPAQLAERVLTLSPFRLVSLDDYRILLHHLLDTDQIQGTEAGGLIVGLAGERVTNSFKFYAVFQDDEEFTVRWDSQELGTVVLPPPVGERLAIAGHVWLVEDIDRKRHLVYVSKVKGKVPAYFGNCPGDIHTRVLERMRDALGEGALYPYLMENARTRLKVARRVADHAGILSKPLVHLGGSSWALFPWLGTYPFMALERLLKRRCARDLGLRGMNAAKPYYLQFSMDADETRFFEVLGQQMSIPLDPMELLYDGEVPYFEKYDTLLPAELVRKGFAYGVLDTATMFARLAQWTGVAAPEVRALPSR